jgi:uroporphyrin-III C-methyltransferase
MSLEKAIARLNHAQPALEPGHVWLGGAGPGDPGCLTLDVLSALDQADALVSSAGVSVGDLDLVFLVHLQFLHTYEPNA